MVGEVALLLVEEGQLALEPVEGCRAGGRRGRGGCLLLLLRGQKNLPFINIIGMDEILVKTAQSRQFRSSNPSILRHRGI